MTQITPFTFVDSVSSKKQDLFKQGVPTNLYVPYIVNNALAYFVDTVFYANEMNKLGHLPVHMQYRFYLNTITPRKRYAKWVKAQDRGDIKAVATFFKFSEQKAAEIMDLLSGEQLKMIKKTVENYGDDIRSPSRGETS